MTKENREEDSGLHDIRSLASSTKARLSSRRSTQNPVMTDDDVLASSSAGWKAVALPEPAKMVSLPELTELPSAKEVKAKDKAARKAAPVAAAVDAPGTATSESSAPVTSIGSRIAAKQQGGGKGKVIAVVGLGLAAAAGVTFFVMNNKKDAAPAADNQVAAAAPAAEYKSTAKMLPPPPPPAADPVTTDSAAAAGSAAPAEPPPAQIAAAEEPAKPVAAKTTADKGKAAHKVEIKDDSMTKRAEAEKKVEKPEKKEEVKKEGGEGEPSFDALLKEAGVSDAKKEAKPKLDKKSLSGADIKSGMGSVAGKAQACYAGTQGTANVKLTVTPDGKVQKVSVSGVFAGTPVAACVESAVKGAQFPAWDGGPQSFGYNYLLSE